MHCYQFAVRCSRILLLKMDTTYCKFRHILLGRAEIAVSTIDIDLYNFFKIFIYLFLFIFRI